MNQEDDRLINRLAPDEELIEDAQAGDDGPALLLAMLEMRRNVTD